MGSMDFGKELFVFLRVEVMAGAEHYRIRYVEISR